MRIKTLAIEEGYFLCDDIMIGLKIQHLDREKNACDAKDNRVDFLKANKQFTLEGNLDFARELALC